VRGDGPIAGRRSSHVIPVMPRRAVLRLSGRDVPFQAGKFCAHAELPPRTTSLKRENGADFGPVSRWVVLRVGLPDGPACYAAPAMYRATRPHARHCSVTCERGGGGKSSGVRSICPEHDGQLSGEPFRSLAIKWSACTGLYVAGRGLRIGPPESFRTTRSSRRRAALMNSNLQSA
jgi:hypothetical protein